MGRIGDKAGDRPYKESKEKIENKLNKPGR